jgi:tetratricopeptide (TPR) repeat protein
MPSSPATRNELPDVQRLLAQASALRRQGQIADAERLYASVLEIAPDDADALHSMGNLKLARGEPGEALRLIGAAMASRAPTPRMLFDLGLAFNALNRHQKALDSFDLAIQLQPDLRRSGVMTKPSIATARRSPSGPILPTHTAISAAR